VIRRLEENVDDRSILLLLFLSSESAGTCIDQVVMLVRKAHPSTRYLSYVANRYIIMGGITRDIYMCMGYGYSVESCIRSAFSNLYLSKCRISIDKHNLIVTCGGRIIILYEAYRCPQMFALTRRGKICIGEECELIYRCGSLQI